MSDKGMRGVREAGLKFLFSFLFFPEKQGYLLRVALGCPWLVGKKELSVGMRPTCLPIRVRPGFTANSLCGLEHSS